MSDTLKKMDVQIGFTTGSGMRSRCGYKGDGAAGIEAIDEITRILTIAGMGKEAIKAAKNAEARTQKDLDKRRQGSWP